MISTLTQRNEYSATAGQTVFAYTFRVDDQTWLKVYVNGVLKTLTTHYTVSGVGSDSGGNVTFLTGLTVLDVVIIIRDASLTQETNYVEADKFPAESHEDALDKLTMIAQDHDEQIGRAIKLPIDELNENWDFPTPVADKYVKVNAAGTGLDLGTILASDISSPITTEGDIIYGEATGAPARLGIGTANQILRVVGSHPVWDDDDAATYAVITTKGDVIVGNAAGAPVRLAIGSTGQILTVAGGTAAWASNPANVITTRGDIIVGNSTPVAARLAAGAEGTRLTVDSSGDVVWRACRSTYARAYRGTNQAILGSTYTKIQCADETADPGANYDKVTNHRYVAPVTGEYLVVGACNLAGTAVLKALQIRVNNTAVATVWMLMGAASGDSMFISDIIQLAAAQYVELFVYSTTDADTVIGGTTLTYLSVMLMG